MPETEDDTACPKLLPDRYCVSIGHPDTTSVPAATDRPSSVATTRRRALVCDAQKSAIASKGIYTTRSGRKPRPTPVMNPNPPQRRSSVRVVSGRVHTRTRMSAIAMKHGALLASLR